MTHRLPCYAAVLIHHFDRPTKQGLIVPKPLRYQSRLAWSRSGHRNLVGSPPIGGLKYMIDDTTTFSKEIFVRNSSLEMSFELFIGFGKDLPSNVGLSARSSML
jgi:hypothetical protein